MPSVLHFTTVTLFLNSGAILFLSEGYTKSKNIVKR